MAFNNKFSHRRRRPQPNRKPTLTSEELPTWFSMKLETGEIYACCSLEHAFAVSCKHSKHDGFGTWAPCYRGPDGFYMPDIIHRKDNPT